MSWKQYGGLKNLDSNNNISVRSVVTDTFTIRNQLLTEFQITGDTQLLGSVLMGDIDNEQNLITIAADVVARKNIDISGNLSVNGKLIITSSGEGFFLQGTDDNRLGINVENPDAVLDIAGSYESILNVFSDQSNNRNIIARNYLQNGIAVNTMDASSSAVQFYSGGDISNNKTNPDSEIKYNSNGILEIITGEDTHILSRVSISNDGRKGHIHNESLVVYDISNGTYRNLYYKEDSVYKGNAFSLIAYDSSSNTSMNITTPDGKGAVISGGAYPKDASKSMLVLDVSNNSDNKPPAQMIVSGTANEKYNTTTSINKFISQIDKYTLDVNGATYISDSQINIKSEYNMEFLNVKIHDNDGIALGSFAGDGKFHIFETTDSGINWTQQEFTYGNSNSTISSKLTISKDIFINDYVKCFVTFSTGSPSLFYSKKSSEWTRYEDLPMNVNDIFNNVPVSSIYSIYVGTKSHFIVGRNTKIDLLAENIIGNSTIPKDVGFTINDIDGSGNTIYVVGDGNIKRYDLNVDYNASTYTYPGSNFTEIIDSSYNNASHTYNKVAVYNTDFVIAVGNGIITHTYDGGSNWQDNIIPDFSANDIHIVSNDEAIAVGDDGKIYVTHNASNTWERLDDNYINGTGMKSYLTEETNNNINSVTISNNNIITAHTNKEITFSGTNPIIINQIPKGRLLSTYAPSLFNRHASSTLDVIGSVNVSGDLIFHDRGELKTMDVSFGLLKTNTRQIDFGLSGELINIGSETGLVDMRGRLQVADDTSFNANVFVSGDISANTHLYLGDDASFNKDVFINGDISANTNLYLGGDASLNSNVFVAGDISANTNLYLGGDASLNSDVFVAGDISANTHLYLGGDASLNSDVFVAGDISANTHLYLGGDASFNKDVFINGDISGNSKLYLGDDAVLYSNLDVCGNTIIKGSLTVDGSLNFTGPLSQTDICHNVLISDQLKVHNIADNEVALVVRQDENTSIAEFKRGNTTKVEINKDGNIVMNSVLQIYNNTTSNSNINGTAGALYVKGGTRLDGSLNVMASAYFKGGVSIDGPMESFAVVKNTNLTVTSNSGSGQFTYDGIPLDTNDKTSNFNVNGGANFKDSIVVDNIFYGHQMDISGDASFNTDVFINGDISGNSKLYLGGDASLNADLFVSGVTRLGVVNNTGVPLYVDGSGAMRIPVGSTAERPSIPKIGYIRYNTDDTTFEGWGANDAWGTLGGVSNPEKTTQVYVGTNDEIVFKTNDQIRQTINYTTGDVSINTDLFVNGDISGNSKLYLGGDASLNSNVFVAGDISANTNLYLSGDASLNSGVFIAGDISANTHLYLGGDASLNSDVFIAGDISANTHLYLGGDASLNSKLFVSGDISANTNLYLGGDASLKSNLIVSGDVSANSNLYLGGDVSFNKNLFVSGVTRLGVVNNTDVPLYVDGSGAMRIPVGSNSDRPTDVETGQIRFNTTDDTFEGYDGSNWGSLGGVSNSDKSSRVYINDVSAIVFETNSKIRETIDIDGNVSFDVSNSEGYGEINMRQIGTATIMEVKDSSNNNTIKIQNQGDTFKLIYDQSGVDTSSRMEMKDNEIKLYPKYPESTFTSNYNGVMIGNDSELRDSLYDKTWDLIGDISKDGTKYGNTVSVSQDGKKMAVGEHETTSTTSRVYIYDIYEKDKILSQTININSGHVTSIDINQDGSKVVVGIYDASNGSPINTGGIELYELIDGAYIQVGNISYGTTEDAYLGHTTSINNDGSIFAAGQYRRNVIVDNTGTDDSTIEGGVLIFERQNENIRIIADISNNGTSDTTQFEEMGRSIELNGAGDRIIIGGTYDDSISGTGKHRVYIYQKQTTGSWDEVLDISNIIPNTGMNFGLSVAMSNDGKVIAVATQDDSVSEDGVVFIYELTGDGLDSNLTYTQRGSTIRLSGIDDMDTFGASMSLNADGSVIAIASGSLDNFNGHAYIYKYLNSDWELLKDIPGSTISNLGGIHNYDNSNMHLISDEDGICLDATGNLVAIGAPNLYSADNMDASGNGSAYLYRNQTYTLGVNEKLRVKGDIVVDNGDLTVDSNYEITYKNQTLDARFVPKQTGNIRAVNWGALSARRFEVHFGSWANNNNSPWADCIHFNTWSDDSGGTSNLLCLKKTDGFGMRIFQPTDTTYQNTTNYTDYRDVVLADTTGNVDITGNLAVNGTATTDIIDYNRRKNPFHPTVNYAEDIITNASNMLENNWYIFAKTNGSQSFGADFCMTINESGNHLYLDFSVSYHYGSDYVLNVKTNSSFVNMGIQAIKLKKLGSSIYDDVHLLVQVGGDITDDALSANKFNVSMRGNFGNGGLELVSLTNDTTADTYLTYTHSISNIVSMVAHNDVIIFSLNENGTLTVDGDTMTGSLSVGGDITLSGDSIKSNDDTLDIYPNGTSIASTGWIEMRNTGTTIGGKEIYFNTNSSTSNWGTRKMTIADNGNVGIGIDNPSALLHSYSGSFGDNGFSAKFARNVENEQHNGIGLGTANNVMKSAIFQERISSYTSKLHLCNNNDADSTDVALSDAKLTIYSGNVGIGTTNPGAKLDVNGNTKITGDLTILDSNLIIEHSTNAAFDPYILLNSRSASQVWQGKSTLFLTEDFWDVDHISGAYIEYDGGTPNTLYIGTQSADSATSTATRKNAITIKRGSSNVDIAGRLAIVDSTKVYDYNNLEDYKLHVDGHLVGGIKFNNFRIASKANEIDEGIRFGNVYPNGSGTVENPYTHGGFVEYMCILYGGNVGIGTTDPGAKLDVNGDTNITGALSVKNLVLTEKSIEAPATGQPADDNSDNGVLFKSSLNSYATYNWQKTNPSVNVARIWHQPKRYDEVGSGDAGHHGLLNFSCNRTEALSKTPSMSITSIGNVGIGTDNPTAKLDVNGDLSVGGDTTMNGILTIGGSSWFYITATSTDSIAPEDGQFNVNLSQNIASPNQTITFEYRTPSSNGEVYVYDTTGDYSGASLPQTSVWTTKSFTPSFSSGLSVNRIRFDPNAYQNSIDVRNLKYGDTFITNQSGYDESIGYSITTNQATFVDKSGVSFFADGGIDIANDLYVPKIHLPANSDVSKIYLYGNDYRYSIGWINTSGTNKYGGIRYNAMTFTMNNDDESGFLWRDSSHADNGSQGAMSLTTDGKLTIASNTRIGYGESDTTTPSGAMLDVNGDLSLNGHYRQVVPNANDNNQVFIQTNTSVRRSKQAHHIDTYNHGTSGSDGRQLYLNWYSNSDVSVGGTGGGKLICYNEVEYKGQTLDARFVKVAGDTMTGNLSVSGTVTASSFSGDGSALTGLTKAMVSLSNVDNTSDTAKPISTAQQTALNSKANLASPTFTGTVTAPKFSQSGNDFLIGGKRALVRSTEQLSINWGGDFTSGTYIYLGLTVQNVVSALTFNATSDIRVKTNIETIEPNEALEQINKLEPKTYKFYDSEETHYGLVAQDAEQIIPESVKSTGTKMIPSIGETCKLINSGKTIVLDTKTTTDMVATKLEFDDISGNKQSVEIETFEGEKYIHLKKTIEEHAIKTSDGLTIYVHGHEVNDFRSINYNTIVAANVAATKALTRELNETRTELNETRTELNETRTELNETRTELNETRTELNETRTELNETRTELNETRTELNELKKLVEQLLNK